MCELPAIAKYKTKAAKSNFALEVRVNPTEPAQYLNSLWKGQFCIRVTILRREQDPMVKSIVFFELHTMKNSFLSFSCMFGSEGRNNCVCDRALPCPTPFKLVISSFLSQKLFTLSCYLFFHVSWYLNKRLSHQRIVFSYL